MCQIQYLIILILENIISITKNLVEGQLLMKRCCLIFLLAIVPIIVSAQQRVTSHLLGSIEDICMNPVFSPDGEKIAYTKANYKGLWVFDLNDKSTKQITDEGAAGFAFKWSSDSKSLLSRVSKYENLRRFNSVKIFDVESGDYNQLTDFKTMMPYLPDWANDCAEIFLPTKDGKIEVYSSGKQKKLEKLISEPGKYVKNDKIIVHDFTTGTDQIYIPIEKAEIINLTTSPDKNRVAFEVMGRHFYSMNIDGTDLIDLGKGNRPRWSADSKKIIYMIAEDNGHNFTASDIYSISTNGTGKQNLTNTINLIEMNPCFSPDGKSIAFNVLEDGSIYIMNIEQGRKND